MPVTLNLSADTEQALRAKARRTGQTLELYLQRLAEEDALARSDAAPPPDQAEFERRLEELAEGLPPLPGLPADFSRAAIYAERD
jgi:hypothetical protein